MSSTDRVYHVGVMLGNIHTQHPKELVEGIYDAARSENVNVTLFLGAQGNAFDFWKQSNASDSMSYHYQFNALYDYALISKLDVLIISYGTLCIYFEQDDKEEFISKFRGVPLIILEEYEENSPDTYIMSDNYGSMKNIMEHLIEHHGYKKILHISGPKNNADATDRRRAYIDSMRVHGLPVDDSMIEYGDYSTNVDSLVHRILDNNPDAEAIVSANDEMAISIYRVCKQRGLVVGKDIAVTGYDDMEQAQRMDPPLTTADQNGLDMGYKAFKLAIQICKEHKSKKILLPAHFKKRGSCGCAYYGTGGSNLMLEIMKRISGYEDASNINAAADCAAQSSMRGINTSDSTNICKQYYIDVIILMYKIQAGLLTSSDRQDIGALALERVRNVLTSDSAEYINISRFTETLHQVFSYMEASTDNRDALLLIGYVFEVTDTYIESLIMHQSSEMYNLLQRRNWMAPAMIQKMMENVNNEKNFYRMAMEHIKAQGAFSAYLYLLEKPARYPRSREFTCPKKLYLASEYVNGKITSYSPDKRPVITAQNGIVSKYPLTSGHRYVAFVLFAEEYQYGLMLCEIDADSIGALYGIGLQISTAQAYLQMSKKEMEAKRKLEDTLKSLKEKNQILNFISANDQLTGLYNRRGFMEHVIEANRANDGKRAVVFFSDLDHLKQINDIFGHSDGDFAITHVADILKDTLNSSGFTGRIGGDEFVSFYVLRKNDEPKKLIAAMKEKCKILNATSYKPYYIEFSVGYVEFVCAPSIQISALINRADEVLYEAKKKRRANVVRESPLGI
ncbi:MAG: GGDEF domain-containing protein [Lachnospiraceae bacterium]|nr:GGDEF domain-containing protein [Lachnospiraceae bacterium]